MLEEAGIRPSPARALTLKALAMAARPLSAQEIEERLETVDRSSISRTLAVFTDSHLVHAISDGSGSMKYEICNDSHTEGRHNDEHAHFHCRRCGKTLCLSGISAPVPELPEGYQAENATFVISGLCPDCSRLEKS